MQIAPSTNVFLTSEEYRSALETHNFLTQYENDLDALAEKLCFTLDRYPHFGPNQGACAVINGNAYIGIGKGDKRDELITCLHEAYHVLHSPRLVVPNMHLIQIVREESKANMFAAIAFAPRLRRYEHEQAVYNIYGPYHREVAFARIVHESRFPSWI